MQIKTILGLMLFMFLNIENAGSSSCSDAMIDSIPMTQISVSSDRNGYRKKRIKMSSGQTWRPFTSDTDAWLGVDFMEPVRITSVATKGYIEDDNSVSYATSYYVAKSGDGVNFEYYTENGNIVLFSTDTSSQASDAEYVDTQSLDLYTRHMRLHFQSWVNDISVRFEVYGCDDVRSTCSGYDENDHIEGWYTGYPTGNANTLEDIYCIDVHPERTIEDCYSDMGIEDGTISDSQMSASSENSGTETAANGRLNGGDPWVAATNDLNQWLQIDFEDFVTISKVATQTTNSKAVTEFQLEYGFDGSTFYSYYQVYTATATPNSVTYNDLTIPIRARYLRFIPTAWSGNIGMRVETYGCSFGKANNTCDEIGDAGETDGWMTNWVYCRNVGSGVVPCSTALGMESGLINDADLTASSYKTDYDGYQPQHGRLNVVSDTFSDSCWVTDTTDTDQYLQINLGTPAYVSKIAIQGSPGGSDYRTETYYVMYSLDGSSYTTYEEDGSSKLFTGNTDATTAVSSTIFTPFKALYVRINPQSWNTYPAIRAEVYGCDYGLSGCPEWYSDGFTTPGMYRLALPNTGNAYDHVYCPMDQLTNGVASCKDYHDNGQTTDGLYWIKPSGSAGLAVYCDFDTSEFVNDVILMEVGHDYENETHVSGTQYTGAGSYSVDVTYAYASASELSNLAQSALRCEQLLYYSCSDTYIYDSTPTQYTWWVDGSGSQMTSFPGAASPDSGCFCGQNGNCVGGVETALCNCDQNLVPSRDGGYIVDKSVLPVSAFYAGEFDQSSDYASHTIGKLRCYDADPSTIPTSCQDAADSFGHSADGYYFIDPDGSGALDPCKVYCDFSSVKNAVVTKFEHDWDSVTIQGITGSGKYGLEVNYNGVSLAQIESLMAGALRCEQYIEFQCYLGTRLRRSNRAWWAARDGTKKEYWGGATDQTDKCGCGVLGACLDASYGCHCDSQDDLHTLHDSGYLTDIDSLPVSQIRFGDTGGSKSATVLLGDLKCYHQTSSKMYESCYHMKNDGVTTDGDYFVDPDGTSSGQDSFLVSCDLSHNDTHVKQMFRHDSETRIHVTGFDVAGSYARDVNYDASWEQFEAHFSLYNYQECEQYIKYECYESKLLDSDTGWWVSRTGETMRYWGGGSPDQLSCSCGVDGSCTGGSSDMCHCDARDSTWATDEGYLFNNTYLPVAQIRLGDTDSGEGYITLGQLVCYITTRKYANTCKM